MYSLACILSECLTGAEPWTGVDFDGRGFCAAGLMIHLMGGKTLQHHLRQPGIVHAFFWHTLPGLVEAVLSCLELDKRQRLSAQELQDVLDTSLQWLQELSRKLCSGCRIIS